MSGDNAKFDVALTDPARLDDGDRKVLKGEIEEDFRRMAGGNYETWECEGCDFVKFTSPGKKPKGPCPKCGGYKWKKVEK